MSDLLFSLLHQNYKLYQSTAGTMRENWLQMRQGNSMVLEAALDEELLKLDHKAQ